ncbi:maleylpyruvate isomerase family mycothiol-dependent enzyme [Streptomyces formicae]|uniref:Mycothiol-dependent maleylpyruvate isomerase metal-binding domain-containing protein n=1 Tax=Streptomyces formicae TaxID=1616117 RepID=A0A291Q0V9_9ACTN|nr:maleylpyruvate isomerase family mycothiol-dependent enzyme [Streptomyces formicae]ATL25153.1 hypothetical protein KY5_0135 [Streptomyces formicae]
MSHRPDHDIADDTDQHLDTDQLAAALVEQTTAFTEAVAGADWDAPVPTCPAWQLRVLVGHIGQEHRWMSDIVRTGGASPVPDPHHAEPPADWRGWLRDGAAGLVDAVWTVGADTPVWTFVGPRPARFWLRRATHDTTLHRVDAALHAAVPYRLPPRLAADAITELLQLLRLLALPAAEGLRPTAAKLRGQGETMRIVTTDVGTSPHTVTAWLVTRTPEGLTWQSDTGGVADVEVSGTAQDLLLVLARRLPPTRVSVDGQAALLHHWLEHSLL